MAIRAASSAWWVLGLDGMIMINTSVRQVRCEDTGDRAEAPDEHPGIAQRAEALGLRDRLQAAELRRPPVPDLSG
ncbi:MAG: hypothetical protein JJE50_04095 [Actinomycetales bacterium]|nr:hypothetical protein [Actinomycetales bacterium]